MRQMEENIHSGHRERLRKRFRISGFEGWSEHEILEFMLFYALPRCDTNERAHMLIQKFGNLESVLSAPVEDLTRVEGIGEKTAYFLRSLGVFSGYLSRHSFINQRMTSHKLSELLTRLFTGCENEHIYLLMLRKNMSLTSVLQLNSGTKNHVPVLMEDVLSAIRSNRATYVIAAHNHPSGELKPSEEDIMLTRILAETLSLINIRLLEHYIVYADEHLGIMEYTGGKIFGNAEL